MFAEEGRRKAVAYRSRRKANRVGDALGGANCGMLQLDD